MKYIDVSGPIGTDGYRIYVIYGQTNPIGSNPVENSVYYVTYNMNTNQYNSINSDTFSYDTDIYPVLSYNSNYLIYYNNNQIRIINSDNNGNLNISSFTPQNQNSILRLINCKALSGSIYFGILYNDNTIELYAKNNNTPIVTVLNPDVKNVINAIITNTNEILIYQYPINGYDADTGIYTAEVLVLNKTDLSTKLLITNEQLLSASDQYLETPRIVNPYFNISNDKTNPYNFTFILQDVYPSNFTPPPDIVNRINRTLNCFAKYDNGVSFSNVSSRGVLTCLNGTNTCTDQENEFTSLYSLVNLNKGNYIVSYLGVFLNNGNATSDTVLPRIAYFNNSNQDNNYPFLINKS